MMGESYFFGRVVFFFEFLGLQGRWICFPGEPIGTLPCKTRKANVSEEIPCHFIRLHLKKLQVILKRVKHNEDEAD